MIKHLRKTLLLLPFLPAFAVAQNIAKIALRGNIADENGKPVSSAQLDIYNPCELKHNTLIPGAASQFNAYENTCETYSILCTADGFDTFRLDIKPNADTAIKINIVLKSLAKNVSQIEISQASKAISVQGDKVIVDAAQISPGAAATVLDLLMRCPGIIVDEQNNMITMKGKSGVMFMIDDRLQPISGEQLFNFLRNTPATMIDKIELIANPSARYDAAGSAGLINLKIKRTKEKGTSGSVSTGAGQGRYGKLSQGFLLGYRKNKISLTTQFNIASRKSFNQLALQRDFFINNKSNGSYVQSNYLRFPINTSTFRTLADWRINKNVTIGTSINASGTLFNPNGKNYSTILDTAGNVASFFSTINDSHEKMGNLSSNTYIRVNLDTLGSIWSADLDGATFLTLNNQLFTTEYYDAIYQKNKADYLLGGNFNGQLDIIAFKTDYVKKLKSGSVWEAGAKASRVVADNDVRFSDVSSGTAILDSNKSNHFIYTEHIIAAYLQTAGAIKKWQYQLGLRSEQTLSHGLQLITNESFNRHYNQLFPSVNIQRVIKNVNIAGITLSRRIERPDYEQLNPFKFYLDPTTYKAGNPSLFPQLTWSLETQYIWGTGANISVSLNRVNRIITEVIYPSDTDPKITVQTNKNLNSFQSILVTASTPLKLGKKSSGYYSLTSALQNFRGNVGNTPLNSGSPVLILTGQQSYVFNKNWTADANASFQSGQVYGYMKIKALGQFGMGVQRSFWNKKGALKLNVSDIFFTGNPVGSSDFVGYHEDFIVKRETRVAMLSFSYKFGGQQTPAQRRQGGAEEEKQRAQNKVG